MKIVLILNQIINGGFNLLKNLLFMNGMLPVLTIFEKFPSISGFMQI